MVKKLTYEQVKKFFDQNGFILLEKEYISAKSKIKYICTCGKNTESTWDVVSRTKRKCKECAIKSISEKNRLNFDYVKNYFVEQGCELLETEYLGTDQPMKYRCKCGNISKIRFYHFKRGKRCQKCKNKMMSGPGNPNWNPDRESVKLNKYLRSRLMSMLWSSLTRTENSRVKKTTKSEDLLGYTWKDLKEHLFTHPNWVNVKDGSWDIDHIFPIKAFVDYKILDPKIINSLDNLQPLTEFDNLRKGSNYNKEDFEKWLRKKLTQGEI